MRKSVGVMDLCIGVPTINVLGGCVCDWLTGHLVLPPQCDPSERWR